MRRLAVPAAALTLLASALAAHAGSLPGAETVRAAQVQAREAALRSRQLEARASRADGEAGRARTENAALTARIEAAEAQLTLAEARIAVIEGLLAEQRRRLAEREGPAVRLTAALQTMARRPSALALVRPGSVEDTVRVRSLLATTLPEIRRRTAALREELRRGEELRMRAAEARQTLAESRQDLRSRRIALARFEARQRARSESLGGLALAESDRALALGEEARALARLASTRAYQARLQKSLAELPGPVPRPGTANVPPGLARSRLRYIMPVAGRVTTGVGEISDAGVHARGLTLEPDRNARVVAPANGRILHAGPFRSYGQVLIIDHGGGWTTVITGLGALDVTAGQAVRRGLLLGRADRQVTVELRHDGRPVPVTQLIAG